MVERVLPWRLPSSPKHVLTLLAYRHNDKNGRCDPSVSRLAAESGLDRTTVMRAIADLERVGALVVRKTKGMRSSYAIPEMWTGCTTPPVAPRDQSCYATGPVAPRDGTGRSTRHEQEETGTNKKGGRAVALVSSSGDCIGPEFATKAGGTWRVPVELAEKLAGAYPLVDLDAEYKKASAWCLTNPGKRKTARGMPRFLNNWIASAERKRAASAESYATPTAAARLLTPDEALAIMRGDTNAP
jgi:hypothetical protein